MNFLLGLVIGFILGASKFRASIVKKVKEVLLKAKKEVEETMKED